jgi:hypothetical protein
VALTDQEKVHLQYCQCEDSFLPFRMGADHNLTDSELVVAMKVRLAIPVCPPTGFTCPGCNMICVSADATNHLLTCNKNKGNTRYHLHEEINKELRAIAGDAGISFSTPGSDYSSVDRKTPDVIIYLSDGNPLSIDLTMVWPTAPSYVGMELRNHGSSLEQRHLHKVKKHGAAAQEHGHTFHSAVFAGLGACHDDVIQILKIMERQQRHYAEGFLGTSKWRLLVALQRGVARLILSALGRERSLTA